MLSLITSLQVWLLIILLSSSQNGRVCATSTLKLQHKVSTQSFLCALNLLSQMLYWYSQFHEYLTSKKTFIWTMCFSNGLVLVAMWRACCNKPTINVVMYNPSDDTCYMIITMSEWMKLDFDRVLCTMPTKYRGFHNTVINLALWLTSN